MLSKDITINNYTHLQDESALEVFLVGVEKEQVGINNKISPDTFQKTHITTWMRGNYNITKSDIISQIPRKMNIYPKLARDQFSRNIDDAFITYIFG